MKKMRKTAYREITVTFKNGSKIVYTTEIFRLLTTDPDVIEIMDNTTGEIIYCAE